MRFTAYSSGPFLALVSTLASTAAAQSSRTAEYRISAETRSGLSGGMASMLGNGGASRSLLLQLASSEHSAAPQATHEVPPALDLGRNVPLVSLQRQADKLSNASHEAVRSGPEGSARLRIYWGCGEGVGLAQPRVLDAAMIARQHGLGGTDIRFMRELSATNSSGYGEWPNAIDARALKPGASLVGDHLVQANYAPEMRFMLERDRDFLAPLNVTQHKEIGGALRISWQGVDRSRAYFLSVIGQAKDGATVIWTSSAMPLSSFSMTGYVDRAEMTRLVTIKALLPADTRQCIIPKAVMQEINNPVLQMNALGEEVVIVQPRPPAALASWRPAWSVMLRYRSDTMTMLGQPDQSLGAFGSETHPQDDKANQSRKKRRGGLLGAAAGSLLGF